MGMPRSTNIFRKNTHRKGLERLRWVLQVGVGRPHARPSLGEVALDFDATPA